MTLPCSVCGRTDVAPWNLHIRSVLFEQVAWCDPCWLARPLIPAQRVPASEEGGGMSETVWACQVIVPSSLLEDPPALEAHLTRVEGESLLQAQEAGVTIKGTPRVTTQPLVWVADWSPKGGELVAVEAARMVGVDDEPTATAVRMKWHAWQRQKAPRLP